MAQASIWCLVLLVLEGCSGRSTHGQSPHDQGLRSSPELPLPDLIESPLKKYDPGLQDLNATELHLILGKGFHPGFMSVSKPPSPPRGRKKNYWWKRRRRKGRPTAGPQSIRGFLEEEHPNRPRYPPWITDHLTGDASSAAARRRRGGRKRGGSGGGRGRRKKDEEDEGGSSRWRRRLRRLLLSITHCPVRWTWKDVGIRFWPRWVKVGRCGGGKGGGEEIGDSPGRDEPGIGALRKGENRRRSKGGVIPLPRKKISHGKHAKGSGEQRMREKGAGRTHKKDRVRKNDQEMSEAVPFGIKSLIQRDEKLGAGGEVAEGGDLPKVVKGEGKGKRSGRGRRGWLGDAAGLEDEGAEPTCSIPAGMVCRAARKRTITLLRWYCREWRESGESGEGSGLKSLWLGTGGGPDVRGTPEEDQSLKCQWIKVEYPIVTECSCQCPK